MLQFLRRDKPLVASTPPGATLINTLAFNNDSGRFRGFAPVDVPLSDLRVSTGYLWPAEGGAGEQANEFPEHHARSTAAIAQLKTTLLWANGEYSLENIAEREDRIVHDYVSWMLEFLGWLHTAQIYHAHGRYLAASLVAERTIADFNVIIAGKQGNYPEDRYLSIDEVRARRKKA